MGLTVVSIVPVILLLLLLGGLVLGIILWATGGRSGSNNEMACGGCGYAVRGLEALNCPECGADLRQVGIDRGKSGGSRVLGIVLTVCCGGILLLGCLGSTFFFMVASRPSSIQSVPVQAYPTQPSTSTSGTSATIVIDEESPDDSDNDDEADTNPDATQGDPPSIDEPTR